MNTPEHIEPSRSRSEQLKKAGLMAVEAVVPAYFAQRLRTRRGSELETNPGFNYAATGAELAVVPPVFATPTYSIVIYGLGKAIEWGMLLQQKVDQRRRNRNQS